MQAEVKAAYIYESSCHPQNVLMTLNEQRKSGLLCDITVTVQGCDFKAHKAVLASCSSYFNAIITDPANISHNIVLELNSVTKIGMESLLDFAYTAKLALTKSTVEEIISAANELEFKNIEIPCLNFLKQQLQGKSNVTLPNSETQSICGKKKACTNAIKQNQVPVENSQGLTKSGDCPLMAKLSLESNPKRERQDKTSYGFCKGKIRGSQASGTSTITKIESPKQSACSSKYTMQAMPGSCTTSTTSCSSEKSPYGLDYSSFCNSDTDDIASGDDDSETCGKLGKIRKQPSVDLPFTVKEITSMPRSELHDLLTKHPNLTAEQVNAIHEIRRRGKNRIAAQRCRKRKMDCVRMLMAEINVLRQEHATLMQERRECATNACKLSEKFKATCEKLFREKSKKQDAVRKTGIDFEEQAQQAFNLAKKLEDWPCEDLPPRVCPLAGQTDNDIIVVCEGDYKSDPCSPQSEASDCITMSPGDPLCSVPPTTTCYMTTLQPHPVQPTQNLLSAPYQLDNKQYNVVSRSGQGHTMSINFPSHINQPSTASHANYSYPRSYTSTISEGDGHQMDIDCPVIVGQEVVTSSDPQHPPP